MSEGSSNTDGRGPIGLALISLFWTLGGALNIFDSYTNLGVLAGELPRLSDPGVDPWWRLGLPALIVMSSFALVLGFLLIIAVSGFWGRRPWSYKVGLAVPVLGEVASVILLILFYSGAPLGLDPSAAILPLVVWFVWTVVAWSYLRRPHVKRYLHVTSS